LFCRFAAKNPNIKAEKNYLKPCPKKARKNRNWGFFEGKNSHLAQKKGF